MEESVKFIEIIAAGILFCMAISLLFLQLEFLPGGIFPEEASRFEAVYVAGND